MCDWVLPMPDKREYAVDCSMVSTTITRLSFNGFQFPKILTLPHDSFKYTMPSYLFDSNYEALNLEHEIQLKTVKEITFHVTYSTHSILCLKTKIILIAKTSLDAMGNGQFKLNSSNSHKMKKSKRKRDQEDSNPDEVCGAKLQSSNQVDVR